MRLLDGTNFSGNLHGRFVRQWHIHPADCWPGGVITNSLPDAVLTAAAVDTFIPANAEYAYLDEIPGTGTPELWNFDLTDRTNDQEVMNRRASFLDMVKSQRPNTKWGFWNWPITGDCKLANHLSASLFDTWVALNHVLAARMLYDRNGDGSLSYPSRLLSLMDVAGPALYWTTVALSNTSGYSQADAFVFCGRRAVEACRPLKKEIIPFVTDRVGVDPVNVPREVTDLYPNLAIKLGVTRCAIWTSSFVWTPDMPIVSSLKVKKLLRL